VHDSRKFNAGVRCYDKVYTTKKYELQSYRDAGASQVVLVNQSIAPSLSSWRKWDERKWDYGFIGHFEHYRGACIEKLLESGCRIAVGGYDWAPFASKYVSLPNFDFLGEEGFFGKEYHDFWSNCRVGLGFISHLCPDTITTRTFEIPAYHSVLCSPQTNELDAFFGADNYPILDLVLESPESFLEPDRLSAYFDMQKEKIATSDIYHIDAMRLVLAEWNRNENSSPMKVLHIVESFGRGAVESWLISLAQQKEYVTSSNQWHFFTIETNSGERTREIQECGCTVFFIWLWTIPKRTISERAEVYCNQRKI
jgi:hypothetical protein